MAEVNAELTALYADYYTTGAADEIKRRLTAQECARHIRAMLGSDLGSVVDVGAGNGSLLRVLSDQGMGNSYAALEISASGLDWMNREPIPGLREARLFDGYVMPYADNEFDTAVCAHVLEHVEHERTFLRELGRIAKKVYIEVPLEGGARGRIDRRFGHINYYSPMTVLNLLETSGLRPLEHHTFTNSTAYEVHLSGKLVGTVKSAIRRGVLSALGPSKAPHAMAYIFGVVVEKA